MPTRGKVDLVMQIITEVDGGGKIRNSDLERAPKGVLGALLEAILEMKLQHKAEMMAAVEDSKIS